MLQDTAIILKADKSKVVYGLLKCNSVCPSIHLCVYSCICPLCSVFYGIGL